MKTRYSLLALTLATAALNAHDMYIMPETFFPAAGAKVTTGFHVGDSFPDSELSGRMERLVTPRVLWKGGSSPIANLRVEGKRDLGDLTAAGAGELVAAVNTLPSLIELAPAKFIDYLKEEGLADVIAWRASHNQSGMPGKERYSKFAKSVLLAGAPNGFSQEKVGFTIEIVPEADPYKLKAGESLPVQVLFRGKPAADLQIETAWASNGESKTTIAGRTRSDGRLNIPLPKAGKWRLHTIRMERCAEPSVADWESFWASLTLEVR